MRCISLYDRSVELYEIALRSFIVVAHPVSPHHSPSCSTLNIFGQQSKVIKFYEWSDVNRLPITFYSVNAFEVYLANCKIPFLGYERDVIERMLYTPHVACRPDGKGLMICSSWVQLSHVLSLARASK